MPSWSLYQPLEPDGPIDYTKCKHAQPPNSYDEYITWWADMKGKFKYQLACPNCGFLRVWRGD